MNDLYRLENLTQEYNGRRVLEISELEIRRGEIFALVGPSGAGKSTLLRLLAFVEPPASGRILFEGQTAERGDLPLAARRRVTLVFQRPLLLRRTVAENVAYGLRLRQKDSVQEQVRSALDQVGLGELAAAPARHLSGGEMQRVALARALVLDPDVLLLDEPTANLDPYNVGLIESIVREQNEARGTTVVVVTHNVFQAKRLAGRAGLLLGGRLVETAPAPAFFEAPREERTAAFVRGDMVY